MKKLVCLILALVLLLPNVLSVSAATLYAPDGRTVSVDDKEVQDWIKVGWYAAETLFAPDGRSISVSPFDSQKWVNVGWYKAATLYAPDGRSINVSPFDVQTWTNVGWYTYPVTYMYSADGRTIVISKDAVNDYKKVGWYDSKEGINRAKLSQIAYNPAYTGSLTGNVTWQYNKYIGTKPDVGADVLLVQQNHIPLDSDKTNFLLLTNINDPTIHSAEVDGMGTYHLDNIPAGDYYLFIVSRNTNESPAMQNSNISLARAYLGGKITEEAFEKFLYSFKLHSVEMARITIKAGQTIRYSHDFGYTYI